MRISIFGLGYVGCVAAAVLSQKNKIIGVDVNPVKVDLINKGKSPIIEKSIEELMKKGLGKKMLEATTDEKFALMNTDASIICVGTPSNDDGSHNLGYLNQVMTKISEVLKKKKKYHLVIIRSTIPPGTSEELMKKYFKNMNMGLCFNPEFLREGVAVEDYLNPPFTVVACSDSKAEKIMRELYKDVNAEFIVVSFKEAEIIKILCNVFHALKVVFGNEVGRFCEAYGMDGKRVMQILCRDKKLNISDKYLIPGFAFGGSCLPKDLRSFEYMAKEKNIQMPVIFNIEESNEKHITSAIKRIESLKSKKLGFIGLSFKSGTDDLRESPYVRLVEYFIGKGYSIKIYDENVSLAKLFGSNKTYIEKEIPHISSLLVSDLNELDKCDIIVLNRDIDKKFKAEYIIDLR